MNKTEDFDLENQIGDLGSEKEIKEDSTSLGHIEIKSNKGFEKSDRMKQAESKMTKLGENVLVNHENNIDLAAAVKDGWYDVDRQTLGKRDIFYPSSWRFRIKAADVKAVKNWSVVDEENPNSVDDAFTEIIKSCLSISDGEKLIPSTSINSWDRFFFILLIRQYTFARGESEIKYTEECPSCDNEVSFQLTYDSLLFDMPDDEVMSSYNQEDREWFINVQEYGLDDLDDITLYLPTIDKDASIKEYLISRLQNKQKVDTVFIKFLPWMVSKLSKDTSIASKQIKQAESKYKLWNKDTFMFMDDVIKNIIVTPMSKLKTTCQVCGEEVTSDIQFPDGFNNLFTIQNKFKKFGKK